MTKVNHYSCWLLKISYHEFIHHFTGFPADELDSFSQDSGAHLATAGNILIGFTETYPLNIVYLIQAITGRHENYSNRQCQYGNDLQGSGHSRGW